MTKPKEYLFLSTLLLFCVLIRIPALTQPLGPDQGIMSVIGQGLLRGEIPYKDNWEMATPAIFFTYALIYKLFGNTMMAVPFIDTILATINTLLIFILGKKLYGSRFGLVGAFLYAFFSNGVSLGMNSAGELTAGTYWYIAQRESFVSPLIVMGMIFVLKGMDDKKTIWFGLVGFFGGVLYLFKFPFVLIFAVQLCFLNDIKTILVPEQRKEFIKKNGIALLCFVTTLIPVVWFFWAKGAFHQMIDATFSYVFSIYGEMEIAYTGIIKAGFINTITVARESILLWILGVSSFLYIIFNERNKRNLFIACWALASFLIIIAHREFFGYHYLIMFPPLSLLCAYGIIKVIEYRPRPVLLLKEMGIIIILFAIGGNLVVYTSLNYKHYTRFLRYWSGQKSTQWYYDRFNAYPNHEYSFSSDYQVSEFLKVDANSDDMLFVLGGIESVIHVLTNLKSPSRFIYSWFLFSTERSQTDIAARYRKELIQDLENKTPKYIVSIGPIEGYRRFKEFHEFVTHNYQLLKTFPDERYLFVLKV